MANSKISVENLNLHYGENHALKDVNMEIADHAITAFIGPSGCGKSTFLRCLNRMNDLVDGVRITGEVKLDDEDIYAEGVDTTVLRKRIGMVFQQPNPFPMSIYDNIAYGPRVHGMKDKSKLDAIVEESLRGAAIFDEVKDRLKKSALGLSGGQQQRICIARALAVQPEVLLMDEPTSALDPISTSKIEELMEDLKKKAEEQSFLKSRFLASVSHDLRSPLHAIIGGSDILKRQNLPDESKNILEYIRVAGNNLLEQVDTILAYSKLEAGMLTLKDKTYNFYEMIEEQARLCLLNIREKDIVFTVRFLDRFPEQVSGDYLRVAQIFQNILSNACKFTEQGTITLSLHCKMEEGQVWFDGCVEDTGVGMTKEKLAQVFAEYVSFSEDMGVEGFGLGLSIVRQLVEMMHGWVRAESDPGKGTRVSFGFYQKQVPTEISEPGNIGQEILKEQSDPQVEEIQPNWVYPRARVLLVDDMEANRVIFQELAAPWKFILDLAVSGEEAVQMVKEREYQMIILDQMMPGMSGFETADQIQRYSHAPLVLMTADISDEVRSRSIRHGFTDFMPKPIRLQRMRQVLETGIPVRYRELPNPVDASKKAKATGQRNAADIRTLESYWKEVESLLPKLPEYVQRDLHMFQTKVHGIKGISRQIGKEEIAQQAEIMEMAAKTENRAFINRNLHIFLEQLQGTVKEVKQETKDSQESGHILRQEKFPMMDGEQRRLCWKRLKYGFDTYDIAQIEENIKILSEHELPPEEKERLPVVREAYENLDYEIGSKACMF